MGLDMYLTAERPVDSLPPVLAKQLAEVPDDCYLSGYDFRPAEDQAAYRLALETAGLTQFACADSPSAFLIAGERPIIRVTVAYWRKANAIHKWFVDHCQDGVDECQTSEPISREKLGELVAACREVLGLTETVDGKVCVGYQMKPGDAEFQPMLEPGQVAANAGAARRLLPTQAGFFFGGTDYDQFYLEDLRQTVAMLEPLLACSEDVAFRYRSSW